MTAPARIAAFHALGLVRRDRADLPAALASTRRHLDDDRDRSLAADIVMGTLRWQRSLDHLIAHTAQRSLVSLDPEILTILRLSLYQILHLDRVPAAAIVDDAVNLARGARKASATGFVNAVLRSILRHRRALPLPPRPDVAAPSACAEDTHGLVDSERAAALAYLGITHSHPDWLAERWLDRHGFEAAERWVQFDNDTPSLTLRVNTLRTSRDALAAALAQDDIEAVPTSWAPHGLTVLSGNPLRRELDGTFVVQDEASQLIPLVVAARPGERILDLCASPGGKTTAMAADMRDSGEIVASDVRPKRVALLEDNVRASGSRCIQVLTVPTTGALPFTESFDRVLVDAPCSGLGTIRRDPDIRWRRQPSDLPRLAASQVALLLRAADVVRPGGRLVYATCSSEPEENEEVVDALLQARPDFARHDLRLDTAGPLAALLDDSGCLRTLPFAHRLEAFFAAALVRR